MQRHFSDRRSSRKHFGFADMDDEQEYSRRNRSKVRRVRHKPFEKYSRSKRVDWLEDPDDTY